MTEPIKVSSSEVDYQTYNVEHSTPLYLKLYPQNNITTFALSNTAIYGPVQMLIPAKVIDLSKSRLCFTLTIPAQGGTELSWIQANLCSLFNRINLTTQNTNQVLLDISYAEHYNAILNPIVTSQSELQNKSSSLYSVAAGGPPQLPTSLAGANGFSWATSAAPGSAGNNSIEDLSKSNTLVNLDGLGNEYTGGYQPRRLLFSSINTGNTASVVNVDISLASLVPMSVFSMENMLYFSGEQLLLSLYFNGTSVWGWQGSNATSPIAGVAPLTLGGNNISSLIMYLKTEQSQEMATEIVNKVLTSGLQLPLPYPYISRLNANGFSQSFTLQYTRGFGKSLLATIWAPFCGYTATAQTNTGAANYAPYTTNSETLNSGLDHSIQNNLGNPVLAASSYNTYMDQIPILTNSNIDVTLSEPWLYNKYHIKDSCLMSQGNYNIDFAHIDNWCSDPLCYINPGKRYDGLSLDPIHQWSFIWNSTAGAYPNGVAAVLATGVPCNHYIISLVQKELNLTASGVQIS